MSDPTAAKAEWLARYLDKSGMTREQFDDIGFVVMICEDCDHGSCEGFIVRHRSIVERHA